MDDTRESMDMDSFSRNNPEAMPVLDLYCQWLNKWIEADMEERAAQGVAPWDQPLTIDQFFKYGETQLIADVPLPSWTAKKMLVIQAGYGDDGGPATLYAHLEGEMDGDAWFIRHITQEFDTMFTDIYGLPPSQYSGSPRLLWVPGTFERNWMDEVFEKQSAMEDAMPHIIRDGNGRPVDVS